MDFKNRLYLVLAAIFITSLITANLIFQKFFHWTPFGIYTFDLSVGILPYPVTFLVTDLISELYGKKRADAVVWAGFVASIFAMGIILIATAVNATAWSPVSDATFSKVFGLFAPAIFASMIAYLTAQFIDIRLFHFWKRLTRGRHLWLRNNGSTIVSQFVDSVAVLTLLSVAGALEWSAFPSLLKSMLLFKWMIALLDTPFFYLGVYLLKDKIHEDPEENWVRPSLKEELL